MRGLYPETREEVEEEIDRIDRHLLKIDDGTPCAAVDIYRKLRNDLAAELKRTEPK